MATKIFNNLCVNHLETSKAFYTAIGFSINPQFSNETAACVVISEHIFAMILMPEFFQSFTQKKLVNAHESAEIIMALSFDSRAEVDEITAKAVAAGGTEPRGPQDHGFMYTRAFNDPDGHSWEAFWMDPAAVNPG